MYLGCWVEWRWAYENPVGLSMCDCPTETVKCIWVNIWCMLDWILSKNLAEIHFLCINLISKQTVQKLRRYCARAIACRQRPRYCLSDGGIQKFWFGCDFPLFEQFWTQQQHCIFTIIILTIRENNNINTVCLSSFHDGCISCM